MPATSETSTSLVEAYSAKFTGTTEPSVRVKFRVRGGTIEALKRVGVRGPGNRAAELYGDVPTEIKGQEWKLTHARFKQEGKQITIQLGQGTALEIFNESILMFERLR